MNIFKNRTEYPNIPLGYMGEKIANHLSDKALVSRLYKQFSNIRQHNSKQAKDLRGHFSKKDTKIINKQTCKNA